MLAIVGGPLPVLPLHEMPFLNQASERIDRTAGMLRRFLKRHPDHRSEIQMHDAPPIADGLLRVVGAAAHERGWKTGYEKPAQPKLAPPGAAIEDINSQKSGHFSRALKRWAQ